MQPIVKAQDGVIRFQANAIVAWLVSSGRINLNDIVVSAPPGGWPIEDQEQFWQMLGYSVSGFGDLDWVRPETIAKADSKAGSV